jgi:hypothetical protein
MPTFLLDVPSRIAAFGDYCTNESISSADGAAHKPVSSR